MLRGTSVNHRGVLKKIAYTFKLMRNSNGALVRICLPGGIVAGMLGSVCLLWYLRQVGLQLQQSIPSIVVLFIYERYLRSIAGPLSLIVMMMMFLITAPAAYVQATRTLAGQNTLPVIDVYKMSLPFWWRYLISGLLSGIVTLGIIISCGISLSVSLGFILLVVPGIIALVWYTLTLPIVLIEKAPLTTAMKRSREMVKQHIWQAIGFSIYMFVIAILVFLGLNATIRSAIYGLKLAGVLPFIWYFIVQPLSVGVITSFGMAMASLNKTYLYYHLRGDTDWY